MNNLRRLRIEKDEYQKVTAKAIGVSERQYSRLENGESEPRLKTAWALEQHFNESIKYLLTPADSTLTKEKINETNTT